MFPLLRTEMIDYTEENTETCMLILTTIDKKKKYISSTGLWKVQKPHRFCHRLNIDFQLEMLYKSALEYHRAYLFPGYIVDQQQCYMFTDSTVMIFSNNDWSDSNQNQNQADDNNSRGDNNVKSYLDLNTSDIDLTAVDEDFDQIMDDNGGSAYVSEINDNSASSSGLNSTFHVLTNLNQYQSLNQESCVQTCPSSDQDPQIHQTCKRKRHCLSSSSSSSSSSQSISQTMTNNSLIELNNDFPDSNSAALQNPTELDRLSVPPISDLPEKNTNLSDTNWQLFQYSENSGTNYSVLSNSGLKCDFVATNNDDTMKSET